MLQALALTFHLALAPFTTAACQDCGRVMIPPFDPIDASTLCGICIYDFGNAVECFELDNCEGCGAFNPGECTA